jgi:hypothetical protein
MDKKLNDKQINDFRLRVLIGVLALPKFLMDRALERIRANPDKTLQDSLLNKYVNQINDIELISKKSKVGGKTTYKKKYAEGEAKQPIMSDLPDVEYKASDVDAIRTNLTNIMRFHINDRVKTIKDVNEDNLKQIVKQVSDALPGQQLIKLKLIDKLSEAEKVMYADVGEKKEGAVTKAVRTEIREGLKGLGSSVGGLLEQQGQRLSNIQGGISDIQGGISDIQGGMGDMKELINNLNLPKTESGEQREQIIPEGNVNQDLKLSGIGMTNKQRQDLKKIITKQMGAKGAEYAEIVDKIAGESITTQSANDILIALVSLGLSSAVPIPGPVMNNLLNMASRASGFGSWFDDLFNRYYIGNEVITTNKPGVSLKNVESNMLSIETGKTKTKDVEKHSEEKKSTSTYLQQPMETGKIGTSLDLQQQRNEQSEVARRQDFTMAKKKATLQRGANGRFKSNNVLNGALIGATAGVIGGGSATSAVMIGSAGAVAGLLAPPIGKALSEQIPPIVEQVKKRRGRPKLVKNTDEAKNELEQTKQNNANTIRSTMEGISKDDAGYKDTLAMATETADKLFPIKAAETKYIEAKKELDENEKAIVPFEEMKKPLAIVGGITAGIVGAGASVANNMEVVKGAFIPRERPIEVPATIYNQQQGKEFDTAMPNMARGLLRPKFIMPDADILQPSNQELAADALEFAMFDFVEPSSEGAEGTNQTNILKAFQKENENIRYRGAGVVVNSLFGNDANDLTTQQINKMFLGPEIPPMIFSEIQQNLSEYEVNQFDVNNELTGIEFFSPYNNFTNVNPGLGENMTLLFDVVP